MTSRTTTERNGDVSENGQEVTTTPPAACTTACTSEAQNANDDTLAALAAVLTGLDPTMRAKLAAMLVGQSAASATTPPKTERS